MDNIRDLVGLTVSIIGLLLLVTSAVAILRANLAKTQVEALRGDRDDLQKRVDRLESENDDLTESNQVRDATISAQTQKIQILEKVVTGREQLNHLQKQLDSHDKRVDQRHVEMHKMIDGVVEVCKAMLESNQALVESNAAAQSAILDFLKKQEAGNDK